MPSAELFWVRVYFVGSNAENQMHCGNSACLAVESADKNVWMCCTVLCEVLASCTIQFELPYFMMFVTCMDIPSILAYFFSKVCFH
jgi:hypothetical protein